MKKRLSLITIALLIVTLVLAGCGGGNGSPVTADPAGSNTPAQTYELTFQTYGEQGTVTFEFIQRLVDKINAASGGQIKASALPVNSVVSATDLMDAVNQGTVDGGHVTLQYYTGQMPQAIFWTGIPGGINENEAMIWNTVGEGDALVQEVVDAGGFTNTKILSFGTVTSEIFLHSKKPVNSINDLKGMKVRGTGMWGEVVGKLGAIPLAITGAEVYSSFERGVVDAIEWGSPGVNLPFGFHEVGKYLIVPGIHQGSSLQHLIINEDKWNSLPEHLQSIIETACKAMWGEMWSFNALYDADAWVKYKELEAEGKIEITTLSEKDLDEIRAIGEEILAEKAASDPLFNKIYQAQSEFLKHIRNWSDDYTVK